MLLLKLLYLIWSLIIFCFIMKNSTPPLHPLWQALGGAPRPHPPVNPSLIKLVLENVRQRQQYRCQEISSQKIFLHLAENVCHLIYWNAKKIFKNPKAFCKSRLSCAKSDVDHSVRHHTFYEIYIRRNIWIT